MNLAILNSTSVFNIADTFISLSTAFILGGLIGLERQYRQRTAGLRTNVLVAIGATIFVDIANNLTGSEGAVRVIAYVVSGIGFLGAGVIMRQEGNIHGLNTAATLWCSAAIGAAAGSDLIVEAILATAFILAANTLLRPLVNMIDRQPLGAESEVTHIIYVIANKEQRKLVMYKLTDMLHHYNYPLKDLDVEPYGEDDIEIEATLIATSIDPTEMNDIIKQLNQVPQVKQAYWDKNTMA